MELKTLEIYEKLISDIKALKREHKKLILKAQKKTITSDEVKHLHKLIEIHNKLESTAKKNLG